MPDPSVLYATDENIAVRASGDFLDLVPEWQVLAAGSDGVISSGSPWVLSSASGSFVLAGVMPGHIMTLDGPAFGPDGLLAAVDSCTATTITLRRAGAKASGLGQPPGIATGIVYSIPTLGPQIEDATYDINHRFGIDDLIVLRSATQLYDLRELRQATVLTVLYRQYTTMSRTKEGDWAAKRDLAKQELDDLLDRVSLRWKQNPVDPPDTTKFSTRIGR